MEDISFLQPEQFLSNNGKSYSDYFLSRKWVTNMEKDAPLIPDREAFQQRIVSDELAHFFQWPSPVVQKCFLYIYSMGIGLFDRTHQVKRADAESYLLTLTYRGGGKLDYEGAVYTLGPGDAFLINCRKPHYYYSMEEGWGYYGIYFDGVAMEAFYQLLDSYNGFCFHIDENTPLMLSIRQLFHINDSVTLLTEMENNQALTYIMTEVVHCARSKAILPDQIREICRYLESNYEQAISLEQLAERFYMNKYYLCRKFRQYTGQSPIAWLNSWRINMAQYYLVTTDMQIHVIADKVGINSANHFLYLFKRFAHMKPTEYRQKYSLKNPKAAGDS